MGSSKSAPAPKKIGSVSEISNQEYMNTVYNRALDTGESAVTAARRTSGEGDLEHGAERLIQQMVDKRKKEITKNKRLSFSDSINASLTSTAPTSASSGSLTGGTSGKK
jgi:hypothetical protein